MTQAGSFPAGDLHERVEDLVLREGWTLHERLDASKWLEGPINLAGKNPAVDRWIEIVAPYNDKNFEKRLDWDELSISRASWALDPPVAATPQHPDWLPVLEALRQAARNGLTDEQRIALADRGVKQPFVHVWRPAVSWALNRLQQRCADLEPALHVGESAWLDLAEALLNRLCATADQALWELFNQRRTPGQMLLAHLGANGDGTTEPIRETYDNFVAELLDTGYGLVLAEFPVLGRLLAVVTELWIEGSEEMLRRLAESKAVLEEHFAIGLQERLSAVRLGVSDPHRGGRAVAILSFGEGDATNKVVYKPKDMQVDATYQHYLGTLNEASVLSPLRTLTVVSRDGYGFMEWVEHRPCETDEELGSYYFNAGRMMAVLHLLGCTDCHYENLIASGDQLVLIDTETLLEADPRDLIGDDSNDPDVISELQTSLKGSVLRSGLLPHWQMAGAGRKRAFDVSALGIQPPPPERLMQGWLGLNSDGMMAGRSSQPCELPTSLPVGLGSQERLTEFIEQLCGGFKEQLHEALRLRPLLMEGLEGFRGQPRRLVARATRLYFAIQRQMLQPSALRTAQAHGLKLEQLCRSFVLASEKPLNWPMLRAEILQMERLDIPFFEHLIDGEELPLPEGLVPIPEFMRNSGLDAASNRLVTLDQHEIGFQENLIRGAIAARNLKDREAETSTVKDRTARYGAIPGQAMATSVCNVPLNLYRQESFSLGEELWTTAIRDRKGRPEWLGIDLDRDSESFRFGLIGHSLYSGSSGISLLFGRLALASEGEAADVWRNRAWNCFEGLMELAEKSRNDQLFRLVRDLPYGIAGTGGILMVLQLLHQGVGLSGAKFLADRLIDQLRPERLLADEGLDVISGVAGLIGPLLASHHPRAMELALVCGERLLTLQQDNGGWPSEVVLGKRRPSLTGFSHGAAGMGAALAQLAHSSGNDRAAAAARKAVAYERSVYNVERGNWPDFRSSNEANEFMLTWCHGAPGILLSRHILNAADLADEQNGVEIQNARTSSLRALEQMTARNTEPAAHLCCGVLGLTSLLRLDAQASGIALHPQVAAAESFLINQARDAGGYAFFNVGSGSLNLPSLYTGRAGVAMALLEAADGHFWMPQVLSAGLLKASTSEGGSGGEKPIKAEPWD